MTHNVFFWLQSSVSGGSQVNQGPFHLGTVAKLLRMETHGQINYQGGPLGPTSVLSNAILWGIQVVPHGASPLDILISLDNDQWLVRQQTDFGPVGYVSVWAPSTDDCSALVGAPQESSWQGQYALGGDHDMYLSWALPFGGSYFNFNSFGSLRAWWS